MRREEVARLVDGTPVHRLRLGWAPGLELHLLTLGATVQRLVVTGGDGTRRDVALGWADVASYVDGDDFRGATVGRYANRVAGGRFDLDGRAVALDVNDGDHHLHGGAGGFHSRVWTVREQGDDHAVLELASPDGDQGFPGALATSVRFEVDGPTVTARFEATTDAPTVVNLTQHTYLDLDAAGSVDDLELQVLADLVAPVDAAGIPTGELRDVAGTDLDCREPVRIGDLARRRDPQVVAAGGLDHAFVLGPGRADRPRRAVVLTSPRTRTRMTLSTDQPVVQVYTGAKLDPPRSGIALEPGLLPDTPHHPGWPSARLDSGQTYRSTMSWRFEPS